MEILHGIKIFEIFNENKIKKKSTEIPNNINTANIIIFFNFNKVII